MKATIGGKLYNTETAEHRATFITYSNSEHTLYQAGGGEFFLALDDYILDGRRLGPLENLETLAPEICPPLHPALGGQRETKAAKLQREQERHRRLRRDERLLPVTDKEAMTWCIKTQIPDCFKGYLLDCL